MTTTHGGAPRPPAPRPAAGAPSGGTLPAATHAAVFGELPSSLSRRLADPAVAAAVTALLEDGWRPGQLASRVGALPAGADPEAGVLALLHGLREVQPPDLRWAEDRQARQVPARSPSSAGAEQPASPESREHWIREIRQQLGAKRPPRPATAVRVRPPCALCGAAGELFVTRAVRLCTGCVERLETGQLRWEATA